MISCVGVIETKDKTLTTGSVSGTVKIDYNGIFEAKAISNDKVEVTFPLSPLDTQGDYTYVISFNHTSSPVFVKSTDLLLSRDEYGNLKHTIRGLSINKDYDFSVNLMDKFGNISNSLKSISTITFANFTSDFSGITTLENIPGVEGAYSLRVSWVAAVKKSPLGYDLTDAYLYEITVLEEPLTSSQFDIDHTTDSRKKVYVIPALVETHVIEGLKPNTQYLVRVRAIDYDYYLNSLTTNIKREQNTNFRSKRTYNLDQPIFVNPSSFQGVSALMTGAVNLQWSQAQGPFDHYRIYYGPTEGDNSVSSWSSSQVADSCAAIPNDNGWMCKTVNYKSLTTVVTDLINNIPYRFVLYACRNVRCTVSSSQMFREITTAAMPGWATFTGITSIDLPRSYYATDTMYVKYTPPVADSGVINGLFLKYEGSATRNESPCYLNKPDESCIDELPFELSDFDYLNDSEIALSGFSSNMINQEYCFKLVPFQLSEGIYSLYDESRIIPTCRKYEIRMPDRTEFRGFEGDAFLDTTNNFIDLRWAVPASGVFHNYNLFVYMGSGDFDINQAIAGASGYSRIRVPYGYTSSVGFITYSLGPFTLTGSGEIKIALVLSRNVEGEEEFSEFRDSDDLRVVNYGN